MKSFATAAIAAVLFAPGLSAWNYTGHMLSAYVAYKRLAPSPRAHVDEVLRRHPDYSRWIQAMPPGGDRGLEAFLQASIWPDVIKGDPRFWEANSPKNNIPTPLLPGYPDMEQHRDWHYRDTPISAPGAPTPQPPSPNLVTQMSAFVANLDDPYKLTWFIHLAGDAHQPLHAVSRFLKPDDTGDKGGNAVVLEGPSRNLHAFWDDIAGRNLDRSALIAAGDALLAAAEKTNNGVVYTDFETWMRESVQVAREFVYTAEPPTLSNAYIKRAGKIGRERIGLAGLRLAAILNERLQRAESN